MRIFAFIPNLNFLTTVKLHFFLKTCLLAATSLLCVSSCTTPDKPLIKPVYRHVEVSDLEGKFIASYISEGYVDRTETGFKFKCIERTSGEPYPVTTRYPNGKPTNISGPNIIVSPTVKPDWLAEMDGW